VEKRKIKKRLSGVGIVNVLAALTDGGKSKEELSALLDRMCPKPLASEPHEETC